MRINDMSLLRNNFSTNMFATKKAIPSFNLSGGSFDAPRTVLDQEIKNKLHELKLTSKVTTESVALANEALDGLNDIMDNLDRMEILVRNAMEEGLTQQDRDSIMQEINGLNANITAIAEDTNYDGANLLAKRKGQEGEDDEEFSLKELLADLFGCDMTASGLGTDKISVSSIEEATKSLEIVKKAKETVQAEIDRFKYIQQGVNIANYSSAKDKSIDEINALLQFAEYKLNDDNFLSILI